MGMHNFENFDNEPDEEEGEEKRIELIVRGDTENVEHLDIEMVTCIDLCLKSIS